MRKKIFYLLILYSTISFAQWQQTNGPFAETIECMASDGTNTFCGTNGRGVYLSTNGGTTWSPVSTGITNMTVLSLAISATNIFAGTQNGIFLSTNNGASWSVYERGIVRVRRDEFICRHKWQQCLRFEQ